MLSRRTNAMTHSKPPSSGATAEAAKHPGGWVYEIGGGLYPDGAIPPEAIVGAWKVGDDGKIVGQFQPNPNYDPARYPGFVKD